MSDHCRVVSGRAEVLTASDLVCLFVIDTEAEAEGDVLHLLSHLKNPQWRDIHHRPRCMMILQYLGNEDIHGILQHIIHTFMRCNFGFSTIFGFSITI